jgi:hypothetical protein
MARFIPPPGPGRPKGSKDKRTLAVDAKLAELGCDPITAMALVAMDETHPIDLRMKLYMELAQYIAPKRKAVEHTSPDGTAPAFVILGALPDATSADWERRNNKETEH